MGLFVHVLVLQNDLGVINNRLDNRFGNNTHDLPLCDCQATTIANGIEVNHIRRSAIIVFIGDGKSGIIVRNRRGFRCFVEQLDSDNGLIITGENILIGNIFSAGSCTICIWAFTTARRRFCAAWASRRC